MNLSIEFTFENQPSALAHLSGSLPSAGKLDMVVQDQVGRMVKNFSFDLEDGDFSMDIDLSSLKPGVYHAWIDVNQRTFVREFKVLGPPESTNLLDRFKSWLS